MSNKPAIIFDNGTGYSKIGFSGHHEPLFSIPGVEYNNPIKHGIVSNWESMEDIWHDSYFKYLRALPKNHKTLITEAPLNSQKNREKTAEIFFESFEVPGLYIGVQAVMALASSWFFTDKNVSKRTTGTVVDIGDGLIHIVPVIDGYVASSAVKQIPIAGKEVTSYIQKMIRDREGDRSTITFDTAQQIKENFCYLSRNAKEEILTFNKNPTEFYKMWNGFDIREEAFLAPEIFYDFSLIDKQISPLHKLVDESIQECPIDCRKDLYKNIVLSGGSTCFKNFGKRLQKEMRDLLKDRVNEAEMSVNVMSHSVQRHAVFTGASSLADLPIFDKLVVNRDEYMERGASCCRFSPIFGF